MMKLQHTLTGLAAAAALTLGGTAQAAIMLDFGSINPGTNLYAGHVSNGGTIPDAQTKWTGTTATGGDNSAVNDLAAGSVFNSDGTVATGVSVDLGLNGSYATQPTHRSSNASGFRGATGVFANDIGRDYLGRDNNKGDTLWVRISGLAPGTYDVWTYTRYGFKSSGTDTVVSHVGAGDINTDIINDITNTASVTYSGNSNSAHTDTGSWVAGSTFVKLQATVTAQAPDLLVGVRITDNSGNGGVPLNAIQINAIPEPASLALLGLGGLCLLGGRSRRA